MDSEKTCVGAQYANCEDAVGKKSRRLAAERKVIRRNPESESSSAFQPKEIAVGRRSGGRQKKGRGVTSGVERYKLM